MNFNQAVASGDGAMEVGGEAGEEEVEVEAVVLKAGVAAGAAGEAREAVEVGEGGAAAEAEVGA